MAKTPRPNRTRDLVIRPARQADAGAISHLSQELNAFQGDPHQHFTVAAVKRDLFGRTAVAKALIAELDGAPAGYATLIPANESGWAARGCYLGDLYVTAEARARGVGRALLAAVAAAARDSGATYLWWRSKAWNVEAHAFYRKLGAIEEPVMAHALTEARFAALAAEAVTGKRRRRSAPKASR